MNNTGSYLKDFGVLRVMALCLMSALLTSCATMQQQSAGTSASPASSSRPGEARSDAGTGAQVPEISDRAGSAVETGQEDPGINRVVRVIQLGRFVEDRPERGGLAE